MDFYELTKIITMTRVTDVDCQNIDIDLQWLSTGQHTGSTTTRAGRKHNPSRAAAVLPNGARPLQGGLSGARARSALEAARASPRREAPPPRLGAVRRRRGHTHRTAGSRDTYKYGS